MADMWAGYSDIELVVLMVVMTASKSADRWAHSMADMMVVPMAGRMDHSSVVSLAGM